MQISSTPYATNVGRFMDPGDFTVRYRIKDNQYFLDATSTPLNLYVTFQVFSYRKFAENSEAQKSLLGSLTSIFETTKKMKNNPFVAAPTGSQPNPNVQNIPKVNDLPWI